MKKQEMEEMAGQCRENAIERLSVECGGPLSRMRAEEVVDYIIESACLKVAAAMQPVQSSDTVKGG